jgi:hypothetical protein
MATSYCAVPAVGHDHRAAPPQLGEFEIEPGKPYVAKYRFVVSDGEPDAKDIDRMWGEYADAGKGKAE